MALPFNDFFRVINTLGVALRTPVEPVTIKTYYDAIGARSIEIEFVEDAALLLAGGEHFPRVGEWLTTAFAIKRQRVEAQRTVLRDRAVPACLRCNDTGFEPTDDTQREFRRCGCRDQRAAELVDPGQLKALPPADVPDPAPPDIIAEIRARIAAAPLRRMPYAPPEGGPVYITDADRARLASQAAALDDPTTISDDELPDAALGPSYVDPDTRARNQLAAVRYRNRQVSTHARHQHEAEVLTQKTAATRATAEARQDAVDQQFAARTAREKEEAKRKPKRGRADVGTRRRYH